MDRLRRFVISLTLLHPPNKHVIDLSTGPSCVGEEIDLRRFPYDGPVLHANMCIGIKVWPKEGRKIVVRSGFVIGEVYDMPLSCDMTGGVEEGPDLQ